MSQKEITDVIASISSRVKENYCSILQFKELWDMAQQILRGYNQNHLSEDNLLFLCCFTWFSF